MQHNGTNIRTGDFYGAECPECVHLQTLIRAKRAELKSLPCGRVPRQLEKKIREWVRFQFTEEQQEEKVCKKYPCLQQFVLRFRHT